MSRLAIAIGICLAALVVHDALAQQRRATPQRSTGGTQRVYRWTDAQGRVHITDTLPPEATGQARTEINARTGAVSGSVARALTPEEQAVADAAAAEAAAAAAEAERQRRLDASMLNSYATEADLRKSYDDRISLLEGTLQASLVSRQAQSEGLVSILVDAGDTELAGRPVNEETAEMIRTTRSELVRMIRIDNQRRAELADLRAEAEIAMQRFRDLRAGTVTAQAPATTPAPAGR
jgi:hypothetical protein